MAVTDWPAYLLRGIPHDTRQALSEQAEADDISLSDVVRLALCARYKLDCDHVSFGYQSALDSDRDILLIRLQPEVWAKMKKETHGRYGDTKRVILEALTHYLEEQTQP